MAPIVTVISHLPEVFVLILDFETEQLPFTDQRCLPFELVVRRDDVFVEYDGRNVDAFHLTVGLVAAEAVPVIATGDDHATTARRAIEAISRMFLLPGLIVSLALSPLRTEMPQQR